MIIFKVLLHLHFVQTVRKLVYIHCDVFYTFSSFCGIMLRLIRLQNLRRGMLELLSCMNLSVKSYRKKTKKWPRSYYSQKLSKFFYAIFWLYVHQLAKRNLQKIKRWTWRHCERALERCWNSWYCYSWSW